MRFNLSLRGKIILIGGSQLVVLGAVLFAGYWHHSRAAARQECVAKARSVALTAEAVREEMGRKWDLGLFSKDQIVSWAREGHLDRVLAAVPVVTGWKAGMAKAAEGGYTFRVPKNHARNPKNNPDAVEAEALARLEKGDIGEYHVLDASLNAVRYFRPIRLTEDCMLCHGDPATSAELWGNDKGLDPTGARMENWKPGEVHGAFEIIQSLDEADARVRASLLEGGVAVVILLAAGGAVLAWMATRAIVRPFRRMVAFSQAIAGGDVSGTCDLRSHDETGQLAAALNGMCTSLRTMLRDIRQRAETLGESSAQLTQTGEELTRGADETKSQSATVAAAAEEMSVNMGNMAASTGQMSDSVKTVAAAAEQMTAAISEVARSAEQAAAVADNAARLAESSNARVTELGQAAREVSKVTELIQDIAEQTNLLALNATIEAARAGEAGKGFAVVATEVKNLARQTAEATEDIRRRIEGIQASAGETVRAIGEIGEVVGQVRQASRTIASAVEEQSITTREISESVSRAAVAAQTVSTNVAETAAATREITQSIARVDANARRTFESAGATQAAGWQLNELAAGLRENLARFRTDPQAAAPDPAAPRAENAG